MTSIAEALEVATRHHQAGQWAEAERIYRQILAVEPDHAATVHQLGMLALQVRQFGPAIELLKRAVQLDRSQAASHANLAEAYRHAGQMPEAIASCRTALKLAPHLVQLQTMLGMLLQSSGNPTEAAAAFREVLRQRPEDVQARMQLGFLLHEQGKLSDAEACFRRVLRSDPGSADAQFNLAGVLGSRGAAQDAIEGYRAALALNPQHVDAHNNLANLLKNAGEWQQAEAHYQAALRINPNHSAALTNLGLLYGSLGRIDESITCYRAAVAADPNAYAAWNNLGTALQAIGQYEESIPCYREALRSAPRYALAHFGIANALRWLGDFSGAFTSYQETLQCDPDFVEAYANLGAMCQEVGMQDDAIEYSRRAIEMKPGFAEAYGNLAVALQALGRLDEAIAVHRHAIAADPKSSGRHSNLLYALNYHPGYDPPTIFAEHLRWAALHAEPLTAATPPPRNEPTPTRRLRVGYVSAHLMGHAVNFFVEPILANHDHAQFEVFCYSDVAREDATSARLRTYADHWRQTRMLTDAQVFDLVRGDRIDILVDLTGHIDGGRRMQLFARKAAPVQVTYIGYQNTTGMRAMDYRLTDVYSDPPGTTEALHTETLVRLPRSFFCYLPSPDAPPVNPLPASAAGHVTFGAINHFAKVTPRVLEVWADLLRQVPRSRLLLRADMTPSLRARLTETFDRLGVPGDRVELIDRLPRRDYLELIRRIDVALDPFPFNGHTTTCDCLWQGVPVMTLSGNTYVSRFGGSGLATLGLDAWIARDEAEYVARATRLASDIAGLAELRGALRARMAASPLLDFAGFTRNLETEYRAMWNRWCAG